jgi:two-component system chemotaxis sensor kinase CheA
MDDLLSEFLTETTESLSLLDLELVRLEQNPNDPALLGNIFRLVHTIKGTCGFLGLPRLESVAHAAENVLGKVRDNELVVTPEAISLILASLDCVKMIMAQLEATEAEPAGDDSALIGRLNRLANGEGGDATAAEAAATATAAIAEMMAAAPQPELPPPLQPPLPRRSPKCRSPSRSRAPRPSITRKPPKASSSRARIPPSPGRASASTSTCSKTS